MLLHLHSPTCAYNQPLLQSPPTMLFPTSFIFQLPIPPLLVNDIILTISTNPYSLPLYLCNFFTALFLWQPSLQYASKVFSLPQPFRPLKLCQGINEQGILVWTHTVLISLSLSLLPQSIDRDNRTHNH